jgi:ribosomal protein RSM22 (predicted rRNA methylase)
VINIDVDDALARLAHFLVRRHPGFADDAAVVDAARALSVGYTETRAFAPDAAASTAYLAHFGPRAVVAMARALRALPGDLAGAHVVDVGAGSGASAHAWLAAGARRVTLLEQSDRALALASELLRASYPDRRVDVVKASAHRTVPVRDATHLGAAFVVGEWGDDDATAEALQASFARIAPAARTFVVVDAGDHARARRLQTLRDALVADDGLTVHGPCPHRDPCPALARARDWCHDRVEKTLPDELATFARAVGRDDAQMALSWLAWSRGGVRDHADDGVVVIGAPQKDKGRVRVPVCGPQGLRFVQALKRHRSAFDAVNTLPRGARLAVPAHDGDTAHVDDDGARALATPPTRPESGPS